jgi:hypothetical protein
MDSWRAAVTACLGATTRCNKRSRPAVIEWERSALHARSQHQAATGQVWARARQKTRRAAESLAHPVRSQPLDGTPSSKKTWRGARVFVRSDTERSTERSGDRIRDSFTRRARPRCGWLRSVTPGSGSRNSGRNSTVREGFEVPGYGLATPGARLKPAHARSVREARL